MDENKMQLNVSGIVCDNHKCDFRDDSVKMEDYPQWVNKPCPRCGENLLTEDDYQLAVNLSDSVDIANSLSEKDVKSLKESMAQLDLESMDKLLDMVNFLESIRKK